MRELRHDFRRYYGLSYDDTRTDEAIDLIHALPAGTQYKAALSPYLEWDEDKIWQANIIDGLKIINWRLMRCDPRYVPTMVERPWDRENRIQAQEKARETKRRIENTEWRDA